MTRMSTSAAFAMLSCCVGSESWADDAPAAPDSSADGAGLQEIVVTARRVAENQQRVPVAITSLSGEAITQRNVAQVSDLQFSVPNLQIKPSNLYPSVPEFIVRGQRQSLYTDENVVTYVNGVPQGTRALTLYDVASVQVLKGPQGTLFGKNSNGGAVIFTTQKPQDQFDARLDVDLGNYDLKKITAMVNLPIAGDAVALRVAGQVERRHGVFENSYPGAQDMDDRHNDSGRVTLLLKPFEHLESQTTIDGMHRIEIPTPAVIQAAPTNNTGFGALVAILTQQAVAQQSVLGGATAGMDGTDLVRQGDPFHVRVPTGIDTTIPGGHYNPIATDATRLDAYGIANTTSYDLNDQLTVRNIVSYRYERALDQQEPSGISGFSLNISPFLGALGVPGLPSVFPAQATDNNTNLLNQSKTFTEELQLIGNLPHTKFLAGGFFSHVVPFYSVTSNFTVGPADLYVVGPRYGEDRIDTKSRAVFGQVTQDFSALGLEALSLTGGVRYTWDEKNYRASNFYSGGVESNNIAFTGVNQVCNEINGTGLNGTGVNSPTQCYMTGGRTYKAPTWTVSLDYQFSPDTLAYVTTRRGFKAGSANPTTVNHDFAMFGLERLTDVEVGFKNQAHLGSMPYRLNVDAFLGQYKDIQTQDILTFCATSACTATYTDLIIFNVGKATIKGVELDSALKPVDALELDLGYSYQQARYGSGSVIPQPQTPGPVGPSNPINYQGGLNLSGLDFPGVPQHNLTLGATLQALFIPSSFANTTLSANYAYRSRTVGVAALGVYKTPSFGVANARLTFENLFGSHFSLAFWGSNLTDRQFALACSDNRGSIGYATCKWGEPRTFGATISAALR